MNKLVLYHFRKIFIFISGLFPLLFFHDLCFANQTSLSHGTFLTLYKNGAIIHKNLKFGLNKEKGQRIFGPLAKTIIPSSLYLVNTSLQKNLTIKESFLKYDESRQAYFLNLSFDETIVAPDNELIFTYVAEKLDWNASYAITFTNEFKTLRLSGWIDMTNQSGIDYKESRFQFVDSALPIVKAPDKTVTYSKPPKSYNIQLKTDLTHGASKRIQWVETGDIKVKQDYRVLVGGKFLEDMEGKTAKPFIETWVTFQNVKENSLGLDLPKGQAILYAYNPSNGHNYLLGTVPIAGILLGQEISVKLPALITESVSDKEIKFIDTELEQSQFKRPNDTSITEANYKLTLTNNSTEHVTIRVVLEFPQGVQEVKFIRESDAHKTEEGSDTTYWTISVPPKAVKQLKYQLVYISEKEKKGLH